MKYIWLPLTASFLTSFTVYANDTQPLEHLNSEQILADKTLEPKAVQALYRDLDKDQVRTQIDQCQNSYRQFGVNMIGCELDTDKDGIFDHNDQCLNTPAGEKVNFLGCLPDTDKDTVVDVNDKCPLTPLGTKVDANGCKINLDLDNDGVLNEMDKCPNTPAGSVVNQHGCIPEVQVLTNIVFDTDSAAIRDDQQPLLEDDLKVLKDLQADEVVLITGHTDSAGSNAYNLTLSWRRAMSVKNFLVANSNILAASIYVSGQGESSPIASNDTAEGRQKNRRIQLEVIPKTQLPQDAKLTSNVL